MSNPTTSPRSTRRVAGFPLIGAVCGLLAFVCFAAVPFLPVNQTQSSVNWPQNDSLQSVNAPLISISPENLDLSIPVSATEDLRDGENLVVGTVPPSGPEASERGLFVTADEDSGLAVSSLNRVLLDLSARELADLSADAVLEINATDEAITVELPGTDHSETVEEDLRPQVTGIYTEIDDTEQNYQELIDAGLNAQFEINSRFTTAPTMIKQVAMWAGTALALVALASLWLSDRRLRRASDVARGNVAGMAGSTAVSRLSPVAWKKIRPLDGVVVAILGFWHIFGANTSDDGFILSMARTSERAGYMANYYRWYGVPEAPFGTPFYELLAVMSHLGANSMWMRLPTLLAGIGIWLVLSREILPRFGTAISNRRLAHWTAALVFLAFWLPYNNGIRPEPIIAFGTLVTWALFERALATNRFLPAALGTVAATITLTCGPTGLAAVGVFLVALPSLVRMLSERLTHRGTTPAWLVTSVVIGPFLAAGTFVLVPVFADQTLAAVQESTRVRGLVGPALDWYSEYVRYATLLDQTVDGSLTRRFAMITMLVCAVLVVSALLRNGQVIGAATGPTVRLMLIVALSMFFLTFTPTKWTHHFGIYAGLAGAIGALGAVALSRIAMRSPRIRTFCLAGIGFLMALTFAGWNGWWYVSSFGVPWWDKTPQLKGVEFSTLILVVSLITLAVGVAQNFIHEYKQNQAEREGRLAEFNARDDAEAMRFAALVNAPIALASGLVVLFSLLTFTKAFVDQYPAYSVGLGNVKALAGDTDYLADEAMVETNTNDSFLKPVNGVSLGESLETDTHTGFTPSGLPEEIIPKTDVAANVGAIAGQQGAQTSQNSQDPQTNQDEDTQANTQDDGDEQESTGASTSSDSEDSSETSSDLTGGVRATEGINGSVSHLPFDLDPQRIPVLGSYSPEPSGRAELKTSWFELPEATDTAPLLVVSVAGSIEHHDQNGVQQPGEELMLEYGKLNGEDFEVLGEKEMLDIGPSPTWRNLRLPLNELPAEAEAVRLVAVDDSLDEEEWIAVTPPRVPELAPLSSLIDDTTPTLLDWSVAFQFPTLRTFDHFAGVTEIPEYRISPDGDAKPTLSGFMDFAGGGALSTVEAVNTSYEVPSYTRQDWHRDWGSIERYELRTDSTGTAPAPARIDYEEIVRSGLWHSSDMRVEAQLDAS